MELIEFRVSASSNVVKTSDAIVKTILENKKIEAQAVGAGAINQTVKAIASATGKLASNAITLSVALGFRTIEIKGVGERTMIIFKLITV